MWKLKSIPSCGTTTGYDWHTRQNKEDPCQACREAKKNHWRNRRQQNRESLNNWRKSWREVPRNKTMETLRQQTRLLKDQVIQQNGVTCYLCQEPIDLQAPRRVGQPSWEQSLHIDHVIPLSKGGTNALDNLKPCHAYCNQKKASKC